MVTCSSCFILYDLYGALLSKFDHFSATINIGSVSMEASVFVVKFSRATCRYYIRKIFDLIFEISHVTSGRSFSRNFILLCSSLLIKKRCRTENISLEYQIITYFLEFQFLGRRTSQLK